MRLQEVLRLRVKDVDFPICSADRAAIQAAAASGLVSYLSRRELLAHLQDGRGRAVIAVSPTD
jgi:hypothetical protein